MVDAAEKQIEERQQSGIDRGSIKDSNAAFKNATGEGLP